MIRSPVTAIAKADALRIQLVETANITGQSPVNGGVNLLPW